MGGFGLLLRSPKFTQIAGYFGSFAGCLQQEVWHRVRSLNIMMPGQANLAQLFCELGRWIREARQAWVVHDPRLAPVVHQDMSLATLPIGPLLPTPWPAHQRQISGILHCDRLQQLKTNLAPPRTTCAH